MVALAHSTAPHAANRYASDINDDGVLNFFDISLMTTAANQSPTPAPGDAGYDPDTDLNADGSINSFDVSAFMAIHNAKSGNPVPGGWLTDPTDASWTDNQVGYDGYHFDYAGATDGGHGGLYCVRHRVYDPGMGRWVQRDPLVVGHSFKMVGNTKDRGSYIEISGNLYKYVASNPLFYVDPLGMEPATATGGGLVIVPELLPAAPLVLSPAGVIIGVGGGILFAYDVFVDSVPDAISRTQRCPGLKKDYKDACNEAAKIGGCKRGRMKSLECKYGRDLACYHALEAAAVFGRCAAARRGFRDQCVTLGADLESDLNHQVEIQIAQDAAARCADAAAQLCW